MNEYVVLKKRQQLRNNEYYSMQSIFDDLYYKSKKGYIFIHIMELISSRENILLAYRNIKKIKVLQQLVLMVKI